MLGEATKARQSSKQPAKANVSQAVAQLENFAGRNNRPERLLFWVAAACLLPAAVLLYRWVHR